MPIPMIFPSFFEKFSKEMKLIIIYLFMNSDGECSVGELNRFDEICNSLNITEEKKQNVIGYCERLHLKNEDNSYTVIQEIDTIWKEEFGENAYYSNRVKRSQAFVLWTLINLAYADNDYSDPEKKVISHLIDLWKIESKYVQEMNDTANTILALTNQIEWAKKTNRSFDYVNTLIQEYNNNIEFLFDNINISISETNI